MMNFRVIKAGIITILGNAEAGRYQTVGFQRQVKSATEVKGNKRLIQVYYSSGDFPKEGGSLSGPVSHDITFKMDFTVSTPGKGDLAVINDQESTSVEIAAAIASFSEASEQADELMDEFIDIIYQVLMDARNIDLGQAKGIVANRWIGNINKNDPLDQGEYVVLTTSMLLTCRTYEAVEGDEGTPGTKIYDTTIDIENDDVEQTGVQTSG